MDTNCYEYKNQTKIECLNDCYIEYKANYDRVLFRYPFIHGQFSRKYKKQDQSIIFLVDILKNTIIPSSSYDRNVWYKNQLAIKCFLSFSIKFSEPEETETI